MNKIELIKSLIQGIELSSLKKIAGDNEVTHLLNGILADLNKVSDVAKTQEASDEKAIIYIDGSSIGNPGNAGIGVVIIENGKHVKEISEYIGIASNNIAEYSALIKALETAVEHKYKVIEVFSDSALLVNQMTNKYKVKSSELRPLFNRAKKLAEEIETFSIFHIPREKNKEADILSNNASRQA